MELGEPDASGRRRPIPVEGSNYVMDVDCVIMALGTSAQPHHCKNSTEGLDDQQKGLHRGRRGTGKTIQRGRLCRRRRRHRRGHRHPGHGRWQNSGQVHR